MPLIHIHLRKGKRLEFRRALCEQVLSALVSAASAPADSRFCYVHEHEGENVFVHPSYGGVSRTDDAVLIEITLNVGRTLETKQKLYEALVRNLETELGIRPDDVIVSLREVAKENWSFGKGAATYVEPG